MGAGYRGRHDGRLWGPSINGLAKADGRSGSGLETCGGPRAAQMISKVASQSIVESCLLLLDIFI